ncbi:hypothetical protein [Quadrisphaera setariae]|uniref:Protein kinase domain-containing protein n=1 Tax=Quadrisphaera setariae TaxID=2593304 RepID=A0A5C8ZG98_9ACTN|nr:hypothetical protein [Quadrisphaera setariae]TXR56309.1 hypothetical protein FMM08_09325 [Quadrisphaera setariae]
MADRDVAALLRALLQPSEEGARGVYRASVMGTSLAFHRHGTTSTILRVDRLHEEPLAMKVLLPPFQKVPAIAQSARTHFATYGGLVKKGGAADLVDVRGSSERWVLMDFVPGITLAEYLRLPELIRHRATVRGNRESVSILDALTAEVRSAEAVPAARRLVERLGRPPEDMTLDELLGVVRVAWLSADLPRVRGWAESIVTSARQRQLGASSRLLRFEEFGGGLAAGRTKVQLLVDELRTAAKDAPDMVQVVLDSCPEHLDDGSWRYVSLQDLKADLPAGAELMSLATAQRAVRLLWRAERFQEEQPSADLMMVRLNHMAPALFAVLERLRAARAEGQEAGDGTTGFIHADLTPSNLIVAVEESAMKLTVVDFGRNYLHTRSVSGQQGRDALFVAPEVLENESDVESADFYSLGQLLIAAAGAEVVPGGVVPDALYPYTPIIARFCEDLVQVSPEQRLLLYGGAQRADVSIPDLRAVFIHEVDVVQGALTFESSLEKSKPSYLVRRIPRPFAAPVLQARLLRGLQEAVSPGTRTGRDPLLRNARDLMAWSVISAALTVFVGAAATDAVLGLFKIGGGTSPLQWLVARIGEAVGWQEPGWLAHLTHRDFTRDDIPALLVGFSYLLVGSQYYQALFSGTSPLLGAHRSAAGWRSWLAAVVVRVQIFSAPILVGLVVFGDTEWWPQAVVAGQVFVFVCNVAVATFLRATFRAARVAELSTVPSDESQITGWYSFRRWWPSSLVYALVTALVAYFLLTERWQDRDFYTTVVAGLNVVLFYFVKCGLDAPIVRIAITRGCLAAERLRAWHGAPAAGTARGTDALDAPNTIIELPETADLSRRVRTRLLRARLGVRRDA